MTEFPGLPEREINTEPAEPQPQPEQEEAQEPAQEEATETPQEEDREPEQINGAVLMGIQAPAQPGTESVTVAPQVPQAGSEAQPGTYSHQDAVNDLQKILSWLQS